MKASDRTLALSLIIGATLFVAACVPAPEPTPSPAPIQTPPAPAPTPATSPKPVVPSEPEYENWMDAPRTAGKWRYNDHDFATQAVFLDDESELFTIECVDHGLASSTKRIVLVRPGSYESEVRMRLLSETAARSFSAETFAQGEMESALISLSPRDPLLDAIALTRGRFAVETEGLPTLYLPAWAEVTRVIEDCR